MICKLHKNLYRPSDTGLPEAVDSNGNKLISDIIFRMMLPPELKLISSRYKLMCCCSVCSSFDYMHLALNRFQLHLLDNLENNYEEIPKETTQEKQSKILARSKFIWYRCEDFGDDGELLHLKRSDTFEYVQCKQLLSLRGPVF